MGAESIPFTRWPEWEPGAPHIGRRDALPFGELLELLRDRAAGEHDGTGWSPGTFAGDRRKKDRAEQLHAIGLDFDGGERTPDELASLFRECRGFVQTTKKHTAAAPRCRVVVFLSRPVDAAAYAKVWRYFEMFVDEQGFAIDTSTKDASRFWYWPSRPLSGEPGAFIVLEGQPIDPDAIIADLERKERAAAEARTSPANDTRAPRSSSSSKGERRYCEVALEGACSDLRAAPKGTRNGTLARAAYAMGGLVGPNRLERAEAERALDDAIAGWDRSYLATHRATLRRQLTEGAKVPRAIPELEPRSSVDWGPDAVEIPPGDVAPLPGAIAGAWKALDPSLLYTMPPRRAWLLRYPSDAGAQGDGFLPGGKTGLVVADGGIGKTLALIALALCAITGRPWLGHFEIADEARGRRVLLVLAEEDAEEVHRRLYAVARSLRLTRDECELVAACLVVLPLAGRPCALVGPGQDGQVIETDELAEIRRRLAAEPSGWSLVVLDPLARMARGEVESNNDAATRAIQAIESLTEAPGRPTVLVAHHSSKTAVRSGQADARGVTGLRDAVRWEVALSIDGQDVTLKQTKSNYSRPMGEELRLIRGDEGVLRVANASDEAEREAKADSARIDRLHANVQRVVEAIRVHGPARSKNQIAEWTGGRAQAMRLAVDEAMSLGLVVDRGTLRAPSLQLADGQGPADARAKSPIPQGPRDLGLGGPRVQVPQDAGPPRDLGTSSTDLTKGAAS